MHLSPPPVGFEDVRPPDGQVAIAVENLHFYAEIHTSLTAGLGACLHDGRRVVKAR